MLLRYVIPKCREIKIVLNTEHRVLSWILHLNLLGYDSCHLRRKKKDKILNADVMSFSRCVDSSYLSWSNIRFVVSMFLVSLYGILKKKFGVELWLIFKQFSHRIQRGYKDYPTFPSLLLPYPTFYRRM